MRRLSLYALAGLALVLATACASTMTVSSHVDRGVTFARYRTYAWAPADMLPTGDPRLDANPFFKDHLQGEVEKQLVSRGLEGPASGSADLLIHYHANISQRLDVAAVDRRRGYSYEDGSLVPEYEAGTIVLDFVDARTQRVVWRAWAQDGVAGMLANQDKMAAKVHEAVTRMLKRLPPRT